MTDLVKVRVKGRRHTFNGKTYEHNETFMGSAKQVALLPDRLELVVAEEPVKESSKAPAKKDEKEPVKASFEKKGS